MAAFSNQSSFAIEFALRTKLNYYQLLLKEKQDRNEDAHEVQRLLNNTRYQLESLNYTSVEYCLGTQLMNSVLGLLVIPQQQFYDDIYNHSNKDDWSECLPHLYKIVQSTNHEVFFSNYGFFYKSEWKKERNYIRDVLKHMRNAVSHKRISFFPISANNNEEVTHVVFEDKGTVKDKNSDQQMKCEFRLQIEKDELDTVLIEIADYFINFYVKHPNARH